MGFIVENLHVVVASGFFWFYRRLISWHLWKCVTVLFLGKALGVSINCCVVEPGSVVVSS